MITEFVLQNGVLAGIIAFREPGTRAALAIGHQAYGHMAVIPEEVREALAVDFY